MTETAPIPDSLRSWFEEAQIAGLLGPGPVDDHVVQAQRFRDSLGLDRCVRALDLGTGAGVPGLLLACWWPQSSWLLLDGKEKRATMLARAVHRLGWDDRVEVRGERAEVLAHEPACREQFDLVVARSFGPPAVVAECAAGFLAVGGRLAVSEPPASNPAEPEAAPRWRGTPVGELGFVVGELQGSIQLLPKVATTPDRYPRRVGMPAKRPLF